MAVVFVMLLAGCGGTVAPASTGGGGASGSPQAGGELKMAFPAEEAGDTPTLDPPMKISTYGNIITEALYDTLVYQDPTDNTIKPGLATSWTVSDDGKTYTFKLREDAKFHDGTPVNAEAVRFSLDRAVDKQYNPNNAYATSLMEAYDHSEVVDEHTVKVITKERRVNFLPSAMGRSYLGIVSPTAVKKYGDKGFGEHPVGSGPYRFVEWAHGDHITIERNPDYKWSSPIFKVQGPPLVDRITFYWIPEAATRLAALQSGQVNAIITVPEANLAALQADSRFEVMKALKNGSPSLLNLNNQRFPTDQREVRVAISEAIDRDALNKTVMFGQDKPYYGWVEERMLDRKPDAGAPKYDLEAAKKTLDDAGWQVGPDGIRVKDGKRLQLQAIGYATNPPVLEFVQSELKKVGMDVSVEKLSSAAVTARAENAEGNFNILFRTFVGFTNEDPHVFFTLYNSANMPPQKTNDRDRFKNDEVDKLTIQGYQETDPEKRKQDYWRVQDILSQEVPDIPLAEIYQTVGIKKGVHDIMPDARGSYYYLNDVWIEPSAR
ncbi:MAG TPA: ABC transporter substrate-binding protein [Chloroflexota bacterium]|nr:ABC transporter substrate-binding protein [Chloroflexota bacterium]